MLTATPRLARHLGSHHRRERLRQGANAWPTPDILDLNAWLARAWEHSLIHRVLYPGDRQMCRFLNLEG